MCPRDDEISTSVQSDSREFPDLSSLSQKVLQNKGEITDFQEITKVKMDDIQVQVDSRLQIQRRIKSKITTKISKEIPDDNQTQNFKIETGNELYLEI